MFAPGAGDRDNLRLLTIQECRNLGRLRKAGADDANSNLVLGHGSSIIT
jgi:hypothetical protein